MLFRVNLVTMTIKKFDRRNVNRDWKPGLFFTFRPPDFRIFMISINYYITFLYFKHSNVLVQFFKVGLIFVTESLAVTYGLSNFT